MVGVAGESGLHGLGPPRTVETAVWVRSRMRGRDVMLADTYLEEQSDMEARDVSMVLMPEDTRDAVAAVTDGQQGPGNRDLDSTCPIDLVHLEDQVAARTVIGSDAHHGDRLHEMTCAGDVSPLPPPSMLAPGRLSPDGQALVGDLSRPGTCHRMDKPYSLGVRYDIRRLRAAAHRLCADTHPRGDRRPTVLAAWHHRAVYRDHWRRAEVQQTVLLLPWSCQPAQTDGVDDILAEYRIVAYQEWSSSARGETAQHLHGDHIVSDGRAFEVGETEGIRTRQSASAAHSWAQMQVAGRAVSIVVEEVVENHAQQMEGPPAWLKSTWNWCQHFLLDREKPGKEDLGQRGRKKGFLLEEKVAEVEAGHS